MKSSTELPPTIKDTIPTFLLTSSFAMMMTVIMMITMPAVQIQVTKSQARSTQVLPRPQYGNMWTNEKRRSLRAGP